MIGRTSLGRHRPTYICVVITAIALLCTVSPAAADGTEEFLSTGEVVAVTGGAVVANGLSYVIRNKDTTRTPLIGGPLPLEASLQRWLGGECRTGKRNFLDDTPGGMFTPVGAGLLLLSADLAWPRDDRGKETAQDMFLFGMGLFTTKGITSLTKAIVARPRPLLCLEPDLANQRPEADYNFDHSSFFSGHTSSAFFSCAFLNLRVRAIMRRELHANEYRDFRWAPPTLLFGWATFVGWSRIQAYRHYASDVLVGAAVGTLMAELFYSFADDSGGPSGAGGATPMRICFRYSF